MGRQRIYGAAEDGDAYDFCGDAAVRRLQLHKHLFIPLRRLHLIRARRFVDQGHIHIDIPMRRLQSEILPRRLRLSGDQRRAQELWHEERRINYERLAYGVVQARYRDVVYRFGYCGWGAAAGLEGGVGGRRFLLLIDGQMGVDGVMERFTDIELVLLFGDPARFERLYLLVVQQDHGCKIG